MVKRLFGKKTLLENLHNPNIIKVDLANDEVEIIKLLKTNGIKYQLHHSKDHFFDQFDVGLNHQGIVINLKQSSHSDLEQVLDNIKNQSTGLILIVDSIQDAQNFGAILRTCEAFKVDAVIYKKDNQVPINDFVIKTSMGAINHLNLCNVSNLSQVLALLKKHGYWIYASAPTKSATNYQQIKFDKHTALIVGNESKGITTNLLQNADFIIQIPMLGYVQSLNVSVSTGILLAKIREQLG